MNKLIPTTLLFCLLSAQPFQIFDGLFNFIKPPVVTQLAVNDKYKASHVTTFQIELETISDSDICSGTAIGHHALLTASHCEMATDNLRIDGHKANIVAILRDNNDHSIFLLDGILFKSFATVDQTPSEVGDEIYMFGNPDYKVDILRRGIVSGLDVNKEGVHQAFDINAGSGDSGAGIFNSHGNIIAVLSQVDDPKGHGFRLAYAFGLNFTAKQLETARTF